MAFTNRLLESLYTTLHLQSILLLLIFSHGEGSTSGFTTDLIPRHSPLSPFYNPSSTHVDLLHDAFKRSLKRVNHFKSTIQAPIMPDLAQFLMKISLGTPPVEVFGRVDTGSDIIWAQCLPCFKCYPQTIPPFDPSSSSSYKSIPCQSNLCKSSKYLACDDKNLTCLYDTTHIDGSHSSGNLSSETLTLGTTYSVSLPNIVFGCGHNVGGVTQWSGLGSIGLGSGNLSLISQMGQSFQKIFSYCINRDLNSTSKISFGNDAVVSGFGVVTIPIVTKSPNIFYYLSLEAISVGTERIAFTVPDNISFEGNIIIDSGSPFMSLPNKVLDDLVLALEKLVKFEKAEDPHGLLRGCYIKREGDKQRFPNMTAHFKGGDVELPPYNMFTRESDDVVCLAVIADPEVSIYGNYAQMDFLIGFDLVAGTVSFKPTACTHEY